MCTLSLKLHLSLNLNVLLAFLCDLVGLVMPSIYPFESWKCILLMQCVMFHILQKTGYKNALFTLSGTFVAML